MGCGQLPTSSAWSWIGERRHVGVVEVGVAPDLQLELGKSHCRPGVQAKDVDVGNIAQSAATVDRVGSERVVIAGQDDYWFSIITQHLRRPFEKPKGLAVIVE